VCSIACRPKVILRAATVGDVSSIAPIWHRGWQDAHVGGVPDELTAARTEESFWTRAQQRLDDTTVAEVDGTVAGFVMVIGDEVEQMYVSQDHRGSGVAAILLAEAERRVRAAGHRTAWLAVVAANQRARRFYAKRGWVDEGRFDHQAPGPNGPIAVPAHRYVKDV
jgi:GNAT superfamily N-acetyltransferase